MKFSSPQQGFVILFAIIISTMIMLIGAGIFTTSFKESILASAATESQIALFAADTGMECALFNEFFARPQALYPGEILCAQQLISEAQGPLSTVVVTLYAYDFLFSLPTSPTCGEVEVIRDEVRDVDDGNGGLISTPGTLIISRGYNICNGDRPDLSNPTIVERRLEAWYPYPAPAPTGP
jgi:hypothetical protein